MDVCCGNPNCFNAGKVFNDANMIDDVRKRKICNACHQTSLVPAKADVQCSGCRDNCNTHLLKKYYKIHGRTGICCCEGCLARTLMHDDEVDLVIKGRKYTPLW